MHTKASLPQNLCLICANSMETFYAFVKLAEKFDVVLKEVLKNLIAKGRYKGSEEISSEEIAIKSEEIEDESEDFNQGDSFTCQPSENSSGLPLYILDIVKEEPQLCEITSIVESNNDAEINESEKFESSLDHPKRSIEQLDYVLSRKGSCLASADTENIDFEDDIPISLFSKRLDKTVDDTDSQSTSCDEITQRNEAIRHRCKICGKNFKGKSYLKIHLGNHNAITPKCHKCGKEFKHANTLRLHTMKWHANAKPFKCENCGKSLSSKEGFDSHMEICKQNKEEKIEC